MAGTVSDRASAGIRDAAILTPGAAPSLLIASNETPSPDSKSRMRNREGATIDHQLLRAEVR